MEPYTCNAQAQGYCSKCQYNYPAEENKYRCPRPYTFKRTSPRKKKITVNDITGL
jgi:Zn finger protein HypA/HybF involved in hydrogenase expression